MQEPIVLYEDNHILVVVKPHNMPSQEDSSGDMDFLTLLKSYIKQKYNKPGQVYLGLLHRLDRPTGGVMVFARSSKSASRLSQQIRDREMSKKYFAVVGGIPRDRVMRLVHYIKKDEKSNMVRLVPLADEGAKKAVLDYKVCQIVDKTTLVQINLITGRTHQARIQMSSIGCPIIGDVKYGGIPGGNLALWAYELRFTHPTTKIDMVFKVFPPQERTWQIFEMERFVHVHRPGGD